MSKSVIKRATATPVRVPGRPDSINSESVVEGDSEFSARYKTGKSWADFADQPKWIVQLETADGQVGIGETYRSVETPALATALQTILGRDVLRLDWRRLPLADMRLYDAIETAVLDLAGRHLQLPIHQLLGGAVHERIECSGWTGRRTPEDAARKAREAMERGHRVFKFKCSSDDSIAQWCAAVRESCGDGIKLLLDPNQRWKTVETTLAMMQGVPSGIMYGLEDPIDRQDYAGFRRLRHELDVPLLLHVSLPYLHQGQRPQDLLTALRENCADGFNFNGPMFGWTELAGIAALEGLPCWHGSEVDLGILEASALHAAATAPNCTIPSDIFGELVRVDDLIEPGIVFDGAWALVPQGFGLGVELDRGALERYRAGEDLGARA